MTEYNAGDLVEAVKDDTVVRWRVGIDNPLQMAMWEIELLYTVTVIERATPPLPTEPGIYSDFDGDIWLLAHSGEWSLLTDGFHGVAASVSWDAPDYVPFTRLEPVPVTAKKVLDAVLTFAWADGFTAQLETVAKKFGVTGP